MLFPVTLILPCFHFALTEKRRPRLGVQRTCGDDNTTTGELRSVIVQYLSLVITNWATMFKVKLDRAVCT